MKSSARYLIARTSAEDLLISLQIQTETLGRILRSSAKSFRCAAGYLNLRYQTGLSNHQFFSIRLLFVMKLKDLQNMQINM